MKNFNQQSDEQLISAYLRGNEKAFEILLKRYLRSVYNFIYHFVLVRQDAEDITQEVFVRVWKNLKKFNQRQSFKVWLFKIAKNTTIDFLKRKKVLSFSEFENKKDKKSLITKLQELNSLQNTFLERVETSNLISSAMMTLSYKNRKVLFLRYYNNFTFQEIAKLLGESINTVKSRCRRAIMNLKKIMSKFS